MTYDICVIDPPWKFSSNSKAKPGRNAMRHYECMTIAEIKALPVAEMMAKDSLLFMWTTAPMLRKSIDVPEAWGFRYVTEMIWDKQRTGTGFWVRGQYEFCLIYRRGKFPCPRPAPFKSSVIEGARREHSRKPDSLQDRIDAVWPDARKLEMFARQSRLGWTSLGNEAGKFDE